MLRSLFRTLPRPVPPAAQALPPAPGPKPASPAGGVDCYEGPGAVSIPMPTPMPEPTSDHGAAAVQTLSDIAQTNPDDASLSDYGRMQLTQAAFDACLPWLEGCRTNPQMLDAVFSELAPYALCPESAGMLATVCHALGIVAMQRPGLLSAGRMDRANAAFFRAVATCVHDLPGMAPFQHVLDIGTDAAYSVMSKGNLAVHSRMSDTYTDLLTDAQTPPSLPEIAFLQQALIVLGSVDVDGAYRVRPSRALSEAPPQGEKVHLEEEGTTWVDMVHRHFDTFIAYQGGWGEGPKLCWSIEEALSCAHREPAILQVMFAPEHWNLEAVTQTHSAHSPRKLACDIHSNLIGAMYHAVLHFINDKPSQGWRRRNRGKPMATESQRDFLAHAFTALHRGIMRMPPGWMPRMQLEELHRVVLDGVAQECDAYTLRARMQAYASAAAASPRMAGLDEAHTRKIAEGWDKFKARLYTAESPIVPV